MSNPLAIIVGFGPGNGLGIARAFGNAGYNLALLSRSPEKHLEHTAALEKAGCQARSFRADAGDPAALTTVLGEVISELGEPEVLVYNALSAAFGRPTTLSPESLIKDFQTNVVGAHAAAMAVLPGMRNRRGGTLLFTGGGWALYPFADAASPSLDKAALRNYVFTLAEELQGAGVRVGTVTVMGVVAPGTAFGPDRIGQAFLEMAQQPTQGFAVERQFHGEG